MNRLAIAVALLSLGLASCSRVHRRNRMHDEPVAAADAGATKSCEELCAADSGIDADPTDCLTECAVSTDLQTNHLDEGLDYFVSDEAYNEKGGEEMRDLHNEQAPEEVPECAPEPGYDAETKPEFEKLDTNGDGVIDDEEAFNYCAKACIPDEIGLQLFIEADLNQDKKIDKEEFASAGEDTVNEEAMDKALEEVSSGDDEVNTVDNPPITEFDGNNDGVLDENEAHEVFEHELERRTDNAEVPDETMTELQPEIDEAIDTVDTNDDGVIDGAEYVAKPAEGEGSDLGGELQEAAGDEEDNSELDDLPRAGEPSGQEPTVPPAAAAGLILHHHELRRSRGLRGKRAQQRVKYAGKHAQRHVKYAGNRAQQKVKYAEAIVAAAKQQQRLRKTALAQHQRRLHHAMMLHKQAKHHLSSGRRAHHLRK